LNAQQREEPTRLLFRDPIILDDEVEWLARNSFSFDDHPLIR
jgi:hypothetical protein